MINYLAAQVSESTMNSSDTLGFTRVVNLLTTLDKPIITHNGMLDFMFLYEKFFEPLPEDVLEYKI